MSDLETRTNQLADLITANLGTKGRDFDGQIRRLGRTLPRSLRRDAALISKARAIQSHPKLAGRIDPRKLDRAFSRLADYFEKIDPWERRRAFAFSVLHSFGFGMLALLILTLAVVWWRGLL